MSIIETAVNNTALFSLILMRISGLILFNPILGRKNIPPIVKAGIIITLSYLIVSCQSYNLIDVGTTFEYFIMLLKEFGIGYAIGFVVNLFLYIIIYSGEIIDFQMGLSMSKIYDAQNNISLSLTATFFNILFMLLFFTSNGHLALLRLFIDSGSVIPYGGVSINIGLSSTILTIFADCTLLAVKLAMPMIAVQLLIEAGVGVLMKAVPQVNIFVINIQLKVFVGLLMLIILITPMSAFLDNCILIMFDAIKEVIILGK